MKSLGVVVDSVSLGEIERALAAGFEPGLHQGHAQIVFTADLLDRATLARVVELGIPVNCGSMDMLDQLGAASPGHPVWLRINPGFGHGHSNKTNTGGEQSKHGIWHAALALALGLFAAGFSSAVTSPYASSVIARTVFGIQDEQSFACYIQQSSLTWSSNFF